MNPLARCAALVCVAVALTGCAVLEDAQLTPADGAVSYARELCALAPAERAPFTAAMDEATKPHRIRVTCDRR